MTAFRISRLGHLGDGMTGDGLIAPLTLPGELVTGTPGTDHLEDIKIVTPSADRVTPACRHFRSCGGCQLQHVSDAFIADWKTELVVGALASRGLRAAVRPSAVSPPQSRRRATLSARRTKKGATAGFHARRSDQIVQIPDCRLLHPGLMHALPASEALAIAGASRKTPIRVAATVSGNGLDMDVSGGKRLDGPLRHGLAVLAERHDLARLCWDGETIAERRPPEQMFDGIRVRPPPGSFLQATFEGEQALRADVQEIVTGARRVADLFAGCGTFALPLSRESEVYAAEGAREMVEALDAGWRNAAGLKAVTAETRDLFRRPLLAEELSGFDAAVIDPPRAGAEAQIVELGKAAIPVIAHVSCNPATFARDAAILADCGYLLEWFRVVDQFLWSAHVELVACFRMKKS